jgi:hypothetical protein
MAIPPTPIDPEPVGTRRRGIKPLPWSCRLVLVTAAAAFGLAESAAEEHGRIKRRPPSAIEAERIASEMAKTDSLLRKGDIISTGHGFLIFQGYGADGVTGEFLEVSNPATRK